MTELLERDPPHLFVASREGVLAIQLDRGEAQVLPWGLYGTALNGLCTDKKGVLLAAAARDGRVLATSDGGAAWTEASGVTGTPLVLAGGDGAIFVGTSPAGLHRSDDGCKGFRELSGFAGPWTEEWTPPANAAHPGVSSIIVRDSRVVVAIRDGGLMVSESGGDAFRKAVDGLAGGVLMLAPAPGSDEDFVAATTAGVYRTSKLATSVWRHVYTPLDRGAVTAVAFAPSDRRTIVCGASRALDLAKPGQPQGANTAIYRSTNGGDGWSASDLGTLKVMRGLVTSIVHAPSDPQRVFVGTTAGEIFESRDAGASFRLAAATLPGVQQLLAGPGLT